MKTKESKQFLFGDRTASDEYARIKHMLNNKYYNIYRSNFKTEGLNYRQEYYLMNKFWNVGSIAAFKVKHLDEIGFATWTRVSWDMYGEPETVQLYNEYGSPLVPTAIQTVDKNVVLGYIQSNRKPLKDIVNWYVERIAQVECVINTNLQLHKIPFLIPVDDSAERGKIEDVVRKILNNEIVICVDGVSPNIFTSVATAAPYIIDKLQNYKKDLENDLLTYLGVNNSGSNKVEQLQMSEVNSNNEEINLSDTDYQTNLDDFCKRVQETLGITISIKVTQPAAENDGQMHDNDEKTGPKDEGAIE